MSAAGLNQPPEGPSTVSVHAVSTKGRGIGMGGGGVLRISPLAPSQKGSISATFSGAAVHF